MKITRNMIDSQLRLRGEMIRAINPLGSYGMQGIMGLLSKLALGTLPLKNLNCTKTTIFRKNGTYFRTCILKAKTQTKMRLVFFGCTEADMLWAHPKWQL